MMKTSPYSTSLRSQFPKRTVLALLCASALGIAIAQDIAPAPRQAQPASPEGLQADPAMSPSAPTPVPGAITNPKQCPNPQQITLTVPQSGTGPSPASPTVSDFPAASAGWPVNGSLFNQPQSDKPFGHTFNFRPPSGQCCQYADGVLTVTYKALAADANNDAGGPFRNGSPLGNMTPTGYNYLWGNSPVAVGTVVTKSYPIPASWIATGRVSFGAQDDSAVLKATLQINGCCLTPTQPIR